MKLISMTKKVIELNITFANNDIDRNTLQLLVFKYALFLQQPLKLGMFVPCDSEGNKFTPFQMDIINEKPEDEGYKKLLETYQEAEERVLFKGFELHSYSRHSWLLKLNHSYHFEVYKKTTIEDLIIYKVELTPNAINQLK